MEKSLIELIVILDAVITKIGMRNSSTANKLPLATVATERVDASSGSNLETLQVDSILNAPKRSVRSRTIIMNEQRKDESDEDDE